MSACQRSKARRLAQRAVVTAAGVLVMLSGAGVTGLPGQARADNPQCVADQTDPCPAPVEGSADTASQSRMQPTSRPHIRRLCQPARIGAFCYQIRVR
ncbi:hypothetical protein MBRA_43940 [Mycobacterium branderi]|uniref:Uncharacterized protein n=1 Tax=Mycobacterium branderi TaxID=43348 RepID=A0ABN6B8Y5_9MYCO|nr:hypothetical protein MBRA_43940 [Mycobacterium branderi]